MFLPLNQSAAKYLQNLSIEYEASKFVQIAYNLYNELLVFIFCFYLYTNIHIHICGFHVENQFSRS